MDLGDPLPLSLHRVDAPHPVAPQPPVLDPRANEVPIVPVLSDAHDDPCERIDFDPVQIRAAHTEDLIEFLQQWSEELDDRAARLNADMATHERRERAFRLWMQNRRLELESQIQEYQQAQARAESIARRLAIGG